MATTRNRGPSDVEAAAHAVFTALNSSAEMHKQIIAWCSVLRDKRILSPFCCPTLTCGDNTDYFARGCVISIAQMAMGRMYIPARKLPSTSHASGVRNQ